MSKVEGSLLVVLLLALGGCQGADSGTNAPPVAAAGAYQPGVTGVAVLLDASGSADPDGDSLLFTWTFDSRPNGSGSTLEGADTSTASFVPDLRGTYVVRLSVSDGSLSAEDTAVIEVAQWCRNFTPIGDVDPIRECVVTGEYCLPDGLGETGACTLGDGCSFAAQTGCAVDQTCHPAGVFGLDNSDATLCAAAGAGGQGAGCASIEDCAPGFACIYTSGPAGSTQCLKYCDPAGTPCPGGLTCFDLALVLQDSIRPSFGVGACF